GKLSFLQGFGELFVRCLCQRDRELRRFHDRKVRFRGKSVLTKQVPKRGLFLIRKTWVLEKQRRDLRCSWTTAAITAITAITTLAVITAQGGTLDVIESGGSDDVHREVFRRGQGGGQGIGKEADKVRRGKRSRSSLRHHP